MSFSKASEELFLTRQAVSKKILSLEKRLGVQLFDRTRNGIELTAEGKLYLDYFKNLIQDFETFSETIGKTGAPTARLLIGYELGVIIDTKILKIMREYRQQKDSLELKIMRYDSHTIEDKLLNGQFDIAFSTIPEHGKIQRDFSYIVLENAEYVIVTSKHHPKATEGASFSDFNGERAVYWNMDNSDDIICRKNFNAAWDDIGVIVVPSIQCMFLSSAYTELLMGNAVLLCNAKSEICRFPEITTYPLPRKKLFGCIWKKTAPPRVNEFAESFRKYEIEVT
ncbi:MAG: LysR family transcriptional regulator [Clostridiales bacterium]|nr:LysR family transcriptional regulator [Clostridiales bacterium]